MGGRGGELGQREDVDGGRHNWGDGGKGEWRCRRQREIWLCSGCALAVLGVVNRRF